MAFLGAIFTPCMWAGSALCGAVSCFQCCCTGSMGAGGVKPWAAKMYYVMFLALGTVIAFVLGRRGEDSEDDGGIFSNLIDCEDVTGQNVCSGDSAILRASASSVVFFTIMMIGTLPKPTFKGNERWGPLFGEGFHRGWWGIKILIYFGLFIGSFFLTSFDDDTYTQVARFVSGIFLVLQILVLVSFAYTWNETWLERSGVESDFADGSKGWLYALVAITFALFGLAFGGTIAMMVLYKGCEEMDWFTAVNMVFVVLFTILTFGMEWYTDGEIAASFAPSAIVMAYTTYLVFSASTSNPSDNDDCDPFNINLGDSGLEIFLSLSIATLTLVWTALTVSNNSTSLLGGDREQAAPAASRDVGGAYEIEDDDGKRRYAADNRDNNDAADDDEPGDDKLYVFHIIMVTASFYMAMTLTNWGVDELEIQQDGAQEGRVTMFIKVGASWAAAALYIWTLIAPAIMPDRDFS